MAGLPRPAICLVTDRRRLLPGGRTLTEELLALERFIDEAIEAGVDVVQIRERDIDAHPLCQLTRRVVARARGLNVAIIVNDRVDVARAADAAGVHLPAAGLPPEAVRALAPNGGWLVGRSVHEGDDPATLAVDYFFLGTVFPSLSKPETGAAGLECLRRMAAATSTPVMAIGGVTPERARRAYAAGAAGVAGIGVFLPKGQSPDALGVRHAVAALRAAFGAVRSADPR
jgi:thiamine-phosphate pyrophosphorylase